MSAPEPTPDEIAALLQVEHLLDQRWPETKIEPSTARISALMEILGSPQRGYPCIHVGGTNGKTSVARMIDALLLAAAGLPEASDADETQPAEGHDAGSDGGSCPSSFL